ncbi:MAG: heparinase II/III family protein [Clostridia bacterium]|nr:heparinase II/III family protein [Clostridia bacterium]
MKHYYGVDPEVKKEKLKNSEALKPFLEDIIAQADTAICEDSIAFKMSEYMMFFDSGNRNIYEKKYFGRRQKCFFIFIAYWLTGDEKYKTPLVDYINYICDEFSWCLPAHSELPQQMNEAVVEHVDLFQAETARFLAEIYMCVGDTLPDYVVDRMHLEVRRRIFASFKKGKRYGWEDWCMNWATVCAAGCVVAALYFGDEEEQKMLIPRLNACLDHYLLGIGEDGCCKEGISYWTYGFSHFCIQAEALRVYTDGEVDYFTHPKVEKLAKFLQKVRLAENKVVCFADGFEHFTYRMGFQCFLKHKYPEVMLPSLKYGTYKGNVHSAFDFLWFDENYKEDAPVYETEIFEDSQWFIKKTPRYSLAAKGGRNDEPHNHNDIGSFMITVGDETFMADLGRGEYTRQNFTPSIRYTLLQNGSHGHSVPIINGAYQPEGGTFCAENVEFSENGFSLQMEKAYPVGLIDGIHRQFTCTTDRVVLTDTFTPSANTTSIVERLMTKIEPKVEEGMIDLGVGKILFDASKYEIKVNPVSFDSVTINASYKEHNARDIAVPTTVYQLDFEAKDRNETVFVFEFVI